jgi:SAM-dependent methyltransferase
MSDTFVRSCEHWSEAGRREMDDFYALAWVDYRHLALAFDWRCWFETLQRRVGDRALRLLDVACGSGKFPAALLRDAGLGAAHVQPVAYSLLDPAAFSIREARAALQPPFAAAQEFECTLQDFDGSAASYDIVWATHALYAVPPAQIDAALRQFVNALGEHGVGFIAHACEDAHYLAFYRAYLEAFRDSEDVPPYTSAEQLLASFERLGVPVHAQDIEYTNGAPAGRTDQVQGYLQRCVFDERFGLPELLAAEPTGEWLAKCRRGGDWAFAQRVKLITINAPRPMPVSPS